MRSAFASLEKIDDGDHGGCKALLTSPRPEFNNRCKPKRGVTAVKLLPMAALVLEKILPD
jgi:hypothetical protein